jgi:hypothetical protein
MVATLAIMDGGDSLVRRVSGRLPLRKQNGTSRRGGTPRVLRAERDFDEKDDANRRREPGRGSRLRTPERQG